MEKQARATLSPTARWSTIAAISATLLASASAQEPRPSIVSANLCADQLVLSLADREQILSLGPFAVDPSISFLAPRAKGIGINSGAAEELIRLPADLVVLGRYDNRLTREFLAGKRRDIAIVDSWTGLDETKAEIAHLAHRFGQSERGAALNDEIDRGVRALDALRTRVPSRSFLILHRRGYVLHAGLAADLAGRAGLHNGAADMGLSTSGFVDLERIVATRPDYLMVSKSGNDAQDQGEALLAHPSLIALYPPSKRLIVPDVLTICPGPAIPALAAHLAQEIEAKVR